MAEKRGISETVEMLDFATHMTVRLIQIKKQGAAGLPSLLALYNEAVTAIQGAGEITAELKDLDGEEIKALCKKQVLNSNEIFEALDVKTAGPILTLVADSVDAAEKTYTIWEPIIGRAKAIRADVK